MQETTSKISPAEYFQNCLSSNEDSIYRAHDKEEKVKKIKICFFFRNSPEENIANVIASIDKTNTTIKMGITDILNEFSMILYKQPTLKEKYISCTIELK